MTFDYVILPEQRCIAVRYSGTLNMEGLISSTRKLWADPLYDKTYNGLGDLTRAIPDGNVETVAPLVDFFRNGRTSTGRWAVILANPKFTALTLLFRSTSHSRPWIEIFASWESACSFLATDIPVSIFDKGPDSP